MRKKVIQIAIAIMFFMVLVLSSMQDTYPPSSHLILEDGNVSLYYKTYYGEPIYNYVGVLVKKEEQRKMFYDWTCHNIWYPNNQIEEDDKYILIELNSGTGSDISFCKAHLLCSDTLEEIPIEDVQVYIDENFKVDHYEGNEVFFSVGNTTFKDTIIDEVTHDNWEIACREPWNFEYELVNGQLKATIGASTIPMLQYIEFTCDYEYSTDEQMFIISRVKYCSYKNNE